MAELSVADVLEKAAELIEPEGAWCQGAYKTGHRRCLVGAVAAAGDIPYGNAHDLVNGPWNTFFDTPSPGGWNDAPERTQAEVVAALRAAASKAREA